MQESEAIEESSEENDGEEEGDDYDDDIDKDDDREEVDEEEEDNTDGDEDNDGDQIDDDAEDNDDDDDGSLSDDFEQDNDIEHSEVNSEILQEEDDCGPPSKKAKLKKPDLYKPPTNEELSQLRETENLFHSSLFRMQVTELLQEVMLRKKRKEKIDKYLNKLKEILITLPEGQEYNISDLKWLKKKKIKMPFLQKPADVKGKFKFLPPSSIKVVGSYHLCSSIKPDIHADLALQIPKEFVQSKDYLNQRYLRKRALYLAYVASQLQRCELVAKLLFTYHHGNHMRPILLVTPAESYGKNFTVRIHTSLEEGAFKLNRFHIGKNNIRSQWYSGQEQQTPAPASEEEASGKATPHYNSAVLGDLTIVPHSQCLQSFVGDTVGLKEGISLLKVWLHQRQLNVGYGGFSGFIMTMYIVQLLSRRKLNKLMSSYQIMRNTLIQLSQADWVNEGISLAPHNATDPHRPSLADFHAAFSVVFVDQTGYLNLCADMNKAVFERVKHEAKLSVQFLETSGLDGFDMLFMTPVPFARTFDQVFHLSKLVNFEKSAVKFNIEHEVMDHAGDYMAACIPSLLKLLDRAVGRRAHMIGIKQLPSPQWSIKDLPPQCDSQESLSFGFLLNTEFCNSILDRGPAADTAEAAEFSEFWGPRSELRRFQDGTICEAVLWMCKTLESRRNVMAKVVKHVLNRHAEIPRDTVTFISHQLAPLLKLPQPKKQAQPYGTGEEQHLDIMKVFEKLGKQLRGLKDLPLTINTIHGVEPVFRYAEVFPALPSIDECGMKTEANRHCPQPDEHCPPWCPTMKVVCVLEGSGKWPEDLEAVSRIKAAFYIKLGQLLEEIHFLVNSVYPDHVDILMEGYVFRVELGYMREIALLKMVKTPEGMLKMVDTEESLTLEQNLVALPKLTTTLHGLHQQYGSFSSSMRLAKRWLSSQLLLEDHMPQEAVELMVAHLYLTPAPFTVPCSPLVGFLRFLNLLATHDWKRVPLIVNFNNELSGKAITGIQNKFSKERNSLPLMYIATPHDKLQSVWTKRRPTAQILQRLVLLATESLDVLLNQLEQTTIDIDFKHIFRPPLEVFDCVIHLELKQLARHHHAVDVTKHTVIPKHNNTETKHMPLINYDPVLFYLKELKEAYDEVALFFHDTYGGNFIAVLWKPAAFQPMSFKVSHVNCRMPDVSSSGKQVKILPNVEAILEGFKIIGEGLVRTVETKTEKWKI